MVDIKIKDLIDILQTFNPDAILNIVDKENEVSNFRISFPRGESKALTEEVNIILCEDE